MKTKLLLLLFVVSISFGQQRTCGTDAYMEKMLSNPEMKQQYLDLQKQFESELERLSNAQQKKNGNSTFSTNATIRIPVAVHYPSVVNSSTETVKSCLRLLAQKQLNILNADYNATNSDLSLWTAASIYYPGVNIGNMDVSWEIATQNHPTSSGLSNGTLAVTFGTHFLSNADSDSEWSGYCNLVVRNISGGILGYSPLGGSPSQGMTVVIDNNAFGASMTGTPTSCSGYVPGAPYNLGRTLTHELGHFFNLYHTFQSCTNTNCATQGDRVCDTPPLGTPTYSCPSDGTVAGCDGFTAALTMNYMDYTNDACMYMFTAGQANRMLAWHNTISSQLQTNVLVNNDFVKNNFSIFPNPNKGIFSIQLSESTDNYSVIIIDALGREIFNAEYNQTTDLVQNIELDNALSGMYFVTIQSKGAQITKKIIIE
ncbi:zinc-dependent metalloprotease [Flavobacterium sp.]|uniref:zinc-dependent metalloprotease n=1 Tax=Flavobacterium sp. TaxID=239 RepID=UPI003340C14E